MKTSGSLRMLKRKINMIALGLFSSLYCTCCMALQAKTLVPIHQFSVQAAAFFAAGQCEQALKIVVKAEGFSGRKPLVCSP